MNKPTILLIVLLLMVGCSGAAQNGAPKRFFSNNTATEHKIDSLLKLMTLDEKIGQLNQLTGDGEVTGPITLAVSYQDAIRKGQVGSMLNVNGAAYTLKIQKIAVEESRLGIPLIFGYDVIHGYKTIFPVPLGDAASFDLESIEKGARVAAIEAAASGQHWTFAPMVDIARDPRWGRVMEGAGEDTYYGSLVAAARVKGFQGNNLGDGTTILACAKHFVAYGAAMSGRDYNTVDISERTLYEVYLPPFKAALDAGVATFMSSFNELNGVPVTGNKEMIHDLLKQKWGFDGFVVSDWASIMEMLPHGIAANQYEASEMAMNAGIDMDMEAHFYTAELPKLLKDGKITEAQINESVKRILRLKYKLGLFEDPYRYCDTAREKKELLNPRYLDIARDAARKSMVLLKNDNVLPISKSVKTIAVIGPMADNQDDLIGTWSARGEAKDVVSMLTGIKDKMPNSSVIYAKGCEISGDSKAGFAQALAAARRADVVVVAVGEAAMMSGEALSRAYLDLPGVQRDLVLALNELHKPMVVVVMNGRPLTLEWMDQQVPSILEAWLPGTMGGPAIADVLFGDYNPSGKLPMTFPRSTGQIPLFYNHKNTGRPRIDSVRYTSKYIDSPNTPLYPFGYGLSYTTFNYSNFRINRPTMGMKDTLTVTVNVKNTGKYDGTEIVQLYIRDMVGSVTRPVKELKGIRKVALRAGEDAVVVFKLTASDLAFYNRNMEFKAEYGDFKVFIGSSSAEVQELGFRLAQ
ncbi:glycoside hydrolase family 3 N-terminal domain-containing protein [Williamwhitmania taraxaci]|uniref:Periplasmic beta-glucosidase n=1 Tax=Williamwhitmania taraxaci TaxID=1640674 RepID=A0A1G6N406_9BACT|nr:glycoside hydrolase family 3 N-terminal domain-containing protein [Williamwhitmania taraxaci]SDC62184.1 beta-glucosidase [Williamwhitmania taraxaci]